MEQTWVEFGSQNDKSLKRLEVSGKIRGTIAGFPASRLLSRGLPPGNLTWLLTNGHLW